MKKKQPKLTRIPHRVMCALVGSHPERVGILIDTSRHPYRFYKCDLPGCRRHVWAQNASKLWYHYCSDAHQEENTRLLHRARYDRWFKKQQRKQLRKSPRRSSVPVRAGK
jgi:hypothetical protein